MEDKNIELDLGNNSFDKDNRNNLRNYSYQLTYNKLDRLIIQINKHRCSIYNYLFADISSATKKCIKNIAGSKSMEKKDSFKNYTVEDSIRNCLVDGSILKLIKDEKTLNSFIEKIDIELSDMIDNTGAVFSKYLEEASYNNDNNLQGLLQKSR